MASQSSNDPNHTTLDDLAGDTERAAREDADTLPSTGLLSFYDRLRDRIARAVERRGGKLGSGTASALLLAPDIFILMLRLAIDKDVPKSTRAVLASTLAYFVLPLDLMSEGVIGPVGYLDDLILALSVLARTFGKELEPYAEKYWSGSQPLRAVLGDMLVSADRLLGNNLYGRVRALLAKKGIEIEHDPAEHDPAEHDPAESI